MRGGTAALEVLLLQRHPATRFMGGAWVFPGGALDPGEDFRAAAAREVAEEAGVALPDPAALIELSRWITPREAPIRFDTVFFLAPLPPGARPRADGRETVAARSIAPRAALEAHDRGELELRLPTRRHLELLAGFRSADEVLAWAPGRRIEPVEPRLVPDGSGTRAVLPGEPGYPV